MVVQGLTLLTGARGDGGAVRRGAARAVVEARLLVASDGEVAQRARAAGADLDDVVDDGVAGDAIGRDEGPTAVLLVNRVLSAEGRSRAHLGGRAVPLSVLGELVGS